jgi:hypothetical protein
MGKDRRLKQQRQGGTAPMPKWTAFVEADRFTTGDGNHFDIPEGTKVYINSRYEVQIRDTELHAEHHYLGFGIVRHLSIKSLDRSARHDWRDFQRIKNELVGEEFEAVEKYPKESHLVDTANQYHLYVFMSGKELPFGFNERLVMEHPDWDPRMHKARQRPWSADSRPGDLCEPGSPAYARMMQAYEAEVRRRKGETDGPQDQDRQTAKGYTATLALLVAGLNTRSGRSS